MSAAKHKDRAPVAIEIWDFSRLEKFIDYSLGNNSVRKENGRYKFDGWGFMHPHLLEEMSGHNREEYAESDNRMRSPLERQDPADLGNDCYHRALVAKSDGEEIGFIVLPWQKDRSQGFWHYLFMFIDVHEEHRNRGVATALLRALDESDVLRNKILCLTPFGIMGKKYLPDAFARELNADSYALLPPFYNGRVPRETGWYAPEGERF